jgi:hypothetical protein
MVQLEGRIAEMIARGFRPVAWVAAVGTAALGCYMLSLQVAAERADLAGVEGRIVATQQAIRSLQTELGTRGRLQQLEQWNAEVLALSAPAAGQFLESTVSLARFDVGRRPAPVEAPVRMASAETAAPAAPPAQPSLRLASAETAPVPVPAPAAERPAVRRASLEVAPVQAVAVAAAAPVRPTEPRRSASLLDDGTLRDLRSQARSEQGGGTRN